MKLILGRKIGMTQSYDKAGKATAITLVAAGPCYVTAVKDAKKDGYVAVQMGFGESKNLSKAQKGHLKKAKIKENLSYLTEMRIEGEETTIAPGDKIDVSTFSEGEIIDVSGRSKGKGFAGTIKRHNFSRGPETHGSDNVRRPGSIGMCSFPARVFKGKRMAGHMGNAQTTVKNLKVYGIDPENNLLLVAGSIPGPNRGIVGIKARG